MIERVEEFSHDGKNFVYIDFSELNTGNDFIELIEAAKLIIAKYPENSLYTIANFENVIFDSRLKMIVAEYMRYNKPYVKYGVIIGIAGIPKIMTRSIFAISERSNIFFAYSKEKAIELLLQQGVIKA